MTNYANGPEIPMGLGMALAQDNGAMDYFASLSHEEQQRIIDHTHQINSRQEMQQYVNSLFDGGTVAK